MQAILNTAFGQLEMMINDANEVYVFNGPVNVEGKTPLVINGVALYVGAHFEKVDGAWKHKFRYVNLSRWYGNGEASPSAFTKFCTETARAITEHEAKNPGAFVVAQAQSIKDAVERKAKKIDGHRAEINRLLAEINALEAEMKALSIPSPV